ncbi:hypothetical protein G6L09_11375 [Agrobacterium rhizogenes]|nr:hypothetical protein [Rhizobium rhizogenes]NTH71155.1 hypothetical protein [Rhizobium rhizogenes]
MENLIVSTHDLLSDREEKMDTASESELLNAMLNSEKRGDYRTLRAHVLYKGSRVAESSNILVVRDFARLMVRAVFAWQVEQKNGAGSLLDPLNEQNIFWGLLPPRTGPEKPDN